MEPGNNPENKTDYSGKDSSVIRLARSASEAGDEKSAVNLLKQGVVSNPNKPELYLELSRIYAKNGDRKNEIRTLEKGVKLNPKEGVLVHRLGNAYLKAEQPEKAMVIFEDALKHFPQNGEIESSRGVALDMLGQRDKARQAYINAIAYSPGNVAAQNNLAISYLFSGENDQALEILEKLYKSGNSTRQSRQNLAFAYVIIGQEDKARRILLEDFSENEARDNIAFYKSVSIGQIASAVDVKNGQSPSGAEMPPPVSSNALISPVISKGSGDIDLSGGAIDESKLEPLLALGDLKEFEKMAGINAGVNKAKRDGSNLVAPEPSGDMLTQVLQDGGTGVEEGGVPDANGEDIGRGWFIELGSYSAKSVAERRLAYLAPKLASVNQVGRVVEHQRKSSILLGPYENFQEFSKVCSELKRDNINCNIIKR